MTFIPLPTMNIGVMGFAHVHQFGNFCLHIAYSGGLVLNITHFPVVAVDLQSLLYSRSVQFFNLFIFM